MNEAMKSIERCFSNNKFSQEKGEKKMFKYFKKKNTVARLERKIGAPGAFRHKDGRDMRSDCMIMNVTKNQDIYSRRHK